MKTCPKKVAEYAIANDCNHVIGPFLREDVASAFCDGQGLMGERGGGFSDCQLVMLGSNIFIVANDCEADDAEHVEDVTFTEYEAEPLFCEEL